MARINWRITQRAKGFSIFSIEKVSILCNGIFSYKVTTNSLCYASFVGLQPTKTFAELDLLHVVCLSRAGRARYYTSITR